MGNASKSTRTKLNAPLQAVVAGCVADAASLPLHWHYDHSALKHLLLESDRLKNPEFYKPMQTKFYSEKDFPGHYSYGQASVYGEQAIMMLDFFGQHSVFSEPSADLGETFSRFMYDWFKKYTGRLDHPTKEFLEKADKLIETDPDARLFPAAGADDHQTMFTFKVPIVALVFANAKEFNAEMYLKTVDIVTRAHQNHPIAMAFARTYAVLLKELHVGKKSIAELIEMTIETDQDELVREATKFAWDKRSEINPDASADFDAMKAFGAEVCKFAVNHADKDKPVSEGMAKVIGYSCVFPGAYVAAMKIISDAIVTFPDPKTFQAEAYASCVRRNILYGGDNCGRSFLIGTILSFAGCKVPDSFDSQFGEKPLVLERIDLALKHNVQ